MSGYFAIQRGIFDHPALSSKEPFSEREAWIWLIEKANYCPQRFRSGYEVFEVPRGALATHYRAIAKEWRWDHKRVARFLKLLQNEGMIAIETPHRTVQITLCNYERHQRWWDNEAPAPPQQSPSAAPKEGTKRIEGNTGKKGMNNTPSYSPEFEEMWAAYPRKDGSKADAFKAYQLAIKSGETHGRIIAGVREFSAHVQREATERRYIAHTTTWLNQRRWESDYTALIPRQPRGANELPEAANLGKSKWEVAAAGVLEKIERGEI
jgi:hypothetical protein